MSIVSSNVLTTAPDVIELFAAYCNCTTCTCTGTCSTFFRICSYPFWHLFHPLLPSFQHYHGAKNVGVGPMMSTKRPLLWGGRLRRSSPLRQPSSKRTSLPPANLSVGKCCICGRKILAVTGEPRPYPQSWPQELQIYLDDEDDDEGTSIAHRKCLQRIRQLRTEYISGAINERWDAAPPLGSPRSTLQARQRRRNNKQQSLEYSANKPFLATVRPPLTSSVGTRLSRPSDSLFGKKKVPIVPPPQIIPFQHRRTQLPVSPIKSKRNTIPQLQVSQGKLVAGTKGTRRSRKLNVRVVLIEDE